MAVDVHRSSFAMARYAGLNHLSGSIFGFQRAVIRITVERVQLTEFNQMVVGLHQGEIQTGIFQRIFAFGTLTFGFTYYNIPFGSDRNPHNYTARLSAGMIFRHFSTRYLKIRVDISRTDNFTSDKFLAFFRRLLITLGSIFIKLFQFLLIPVQIILLTQAFVQCFFLGSHLCKYRRHTAQRRIATCSRTRSGSTAACRQHNQSAEHCG